MRWLRNPIVWFAWLVVIVGLLLPMGLMLLRSVTFQDVVLVDGRVHHPVGRVIVTDEEHLYSLEQIQEDGTPTKQPWSELNEDVAEVRTRYGMDHYTRVFGDDRTFGLLRNSVVVAGGGALLALLLGLPLAWILFRVLGPRLPGALRAVLVLLCVTPAILPPFFVALGGARTMQGWLMAALGVEGGTLQILNSILVFGCTLYPLYLLFVGPVLARIPAGPWEAARMLGGRRAAWRTVTLPAVIPAIAGAWLLAFVLALNDFAVVDVLGFMLPKGGAPAHVFATEVFLQWKQHGNTARAVATCAPFVLVTLGLLGVAALLLRRARAFHAGRAARRRRPARPRPLGWVGIAVFVVVLLWVTVAMPLLGIASWAGAGGESAAGGTAGAAAATQTDIGLFEFERTLDKTTGSREQRDRWLITALAAALLAMAVAAPLARQALRGGRAPRVAVVAVAGLAMAWPGVVLGGGTTAFWQAIPGDWVRPIEDSILRSVLVLAMKFLPFALVGAWLGVRQVRPDHESAAALLGAGPWTRAWRIVTPTAWMGVAAGGVLVWLLALRELDTIVLVDARILPMVLYNAIHFNRMAEQANLLFLCLLWFLLPLAAGVLLAALARRRP